MNRTVVFLVGTALVGLITFVALCAGWNDDALRQRISRLEVAAAAPAVPAPTVEQVAALERQVQVLAQALVIAKRRDARIVVVLQVLLDAIMRLDARIPKRIL